MVTDEELWQLGKLEGKLFTQSQVSYTISDLAKV